MTSDRENLPVFYYPAKNTAILVTVPVLLDQNYTGTYTALVNGTLQRHYSYSHDEALVPTSPGRSFARFALVLAELVEIGLGRPLMLFHEL